MPNDDPRITGPVLKVLGTLVASGFPEFSGADITRDTGLASGTLYPILFRLEQAGWLKSRWEADDPKVLGRPRRRFYRITAVGARKAKAAFQDLGLAQGGNAWA